MRILVINTGSMASITHMLPAFTDAANARAKLVIDCVVEARWAEIPSWHPNVESVFGFPRATLDRPWSSIKTPEIKKLRRQLNRHPYDWVFDINGGWLSAKLSRAFYTLNAGYQAGTQTDAEWLTKLWYLTPSVLYKHRQQYDTSLHPVENHRRMFSQVMNYPLPASLGQYGIDRTKLCRTSAAPDAHEIVCLFSSRYKNREYPIEQSQQVLSDLANAGFHIRLPWRDEKSRARAEEISRDIQNVELLPKLNLSAIAAVIAQSAAVVTVDGRMSHLAAVLNVPMVTIYSADTDLPTRVYGVQNRSVYSSENTLQQLPPASVLSAFWNLLRDHSPDVASANQSASAAKPE